MRRRCGGQIVSRRWRGFPVLLLIAAVAAGACSRREGSAGSAGAEQTPAQRTAARLGLHGSAFPVPLPKPHFVLHDTQGEPFDFRKRTEGMLTLLFFGYTSCPDICPLQLSNVAAALRLRPRLRDRLRVVFVGVDPPRDTPRHLRTWLDHFDPSFIGLVGSPLELDRAQRAAGVPSAFVESRFEGGYTVSHAGCILVYTPDGLGRLRYLPEVGPDAWAQDLEVLLKARWPELPR